MYTYIYIYTYYIFTYIYIYICIVSQHQPWWLADDFRASKKRNFPRVLSDAVHLLFRTWLIQSWHRTANITGSWWAILWRVFCHQQSSTMVFYSQFEPWKQYRWIFSFSYEYNWFLPKKITLRSIFFIYLLGKSHWYVLIIIILESQKLLTKPTFLVIWYMKNIPLESLPWKIFKDSKNPYRLEKIDN